MTIITNTIATIVVAGVGMASLNIVTDLIRGEPVNMKLEYLRYDDGKFTQKHTVEGGPILATWAAEITRDGAHLCSSGGYAPYSGDQITMGVKEWAGDGCPESLLSGDKALATWEWHNEDGLRLKVSGEIIIDN